MPIVDYCHHTDSLGSWRDANIALRDRHREIVKAMLPELRRRRYARHLTVDQLAPMLGVSSSYLEKWEWGHSVPPADLFARWRTILDL